MMHGTINIKLTTYSCICWLFHRTYYDARNHKHKISSYCLHSPPSEAESHSVGQEIHSLVWNVKAHYCVHKRIPSVPVLSQMNPVYTLSPYLLKTHFNIIFLHMPESFKCQVYWPKFCIYFWSLPCKPSLPLISPYLIYCHPDDFLVMNEN